MAERNMRRAGKEKQGESDLHWLKYRKHTQAHTQYTKHILVLSQELSRITYQKLELEVQYILVKLHIWECSNWSVAYPSCSINCCLATAVKGNMWRGVGGRKSESERTPIEGAGDWVIPRALALVWLQTAHRDAEKKWNTEVNMASLSQLNRLGRACTNLRSNLPAGASTSAAPLKMSFH